MALEAAEHGDPFRVLIGCILSLRTRDETTAVAVPRLFAEAAAPQAMLALGEERDRAPYLPGRVLPHQGRCYCRHLPRAYRRFDARVPESIDALLTLKGVGRKTANLVVTQAYGKPGICVDTHVHRISNRWGLVETRTPDETETALRAALPRRYWIEYNSLLVAFGQTICQPLSPWCSRCPIAHLCPRLGVIHAR